MTGSLFLLRVRSQQVCSGHTRISVFPRPSCSQFHQASGLLSLLARLDDHFQQIAECLFCADRFLWTSFERPLNGVIINLGIFAVVERASFSSFSRLCVACNSASIFSCHIRRSCSSCRKRNSVSSCLVSNRFLSISSSISYYLLFKNFASFYLSTRNVEYLTFTSFFHCLTDRGDTP